MRSLRDHGIPEPVLERWAESLSGLNQLQQDAVNEAGLLEGRNVLVMAPTSSGKTMIGELAAIRATQHGGRSVFLLPTKALVNEQRDKFERLYGPAGVRTVRATGDYSDQVTALLRGQFDIGVLTYEMFRGSHLQIRTCFGIISVIVIDEVQTLVDPGRGPDLEFLLTLIKSRRTAGSSHSSSRCRQFWVISAAWTAGSRRTCCAAPNGLCRSKKASSNSPAPTALWVQTVWRTPNNSYRPSTASRGRDPADSARSGSWSPRVSRSSSYAASGARPGAPRGTWPIRSASPPLPRRSPPCQQAIQASRAAISGTASLAGSPSTIPTWTETSAASSRTHFRSPDSTIRVIVATTTLAQGVNMPAETVIMPELQRRISRNEFKPYQVAEYKNIAGRAGRLGLTERGRAIVFAYGRADADHVLVALHQWRPGRYPFDAARPVGRHVHPGPERRRRGRAAARDR